MTAYDEKYITIDKIDEIRPLYESCLKLLNGYIKYLRKTKIGKPDKN